MQIDIARPYMYMGHLAPVTAIAFSPDGRTIVSGDTERRILIKAEGSWPVRLDVSSHDEKVRNTERMRSLGFSKDGMTVFVSAIDRLEAVRLDTLERYWSYTPPRFFGFLVVSPLRLAVAEHGGLAACFDNGTVGVWDVNGRLLALWKDREPPNYIGWHPDGKQIVGVNKWQLCVWNPERRRRAGKTSFRDDEPIHGLTVHPTRPFALIRTLHRLRLIDLQTFQCLSDTDAPVGLPLAAFRPGHDAIAVANEHHVTLQDMEGRWIDALDLIDARVTSLAWSKDGSKLAVGSSDWAVRVFDVANV